jgi:hypothetical protein
MKSSGKLNEKTYKFSIDIYHSQVWIVVSDSMAKTRTSKKWTERLGYYKPEDNMQALTTNRGFANAVFLTRGKIDHGVLAHEIYHVTNNIMEYISHELDTNHHEPHCYLCQYITQKVYNKLKEWGEKIL